MPKRPRRCKTAQIEISENSVWRLTQEWGEALKKVEEKEIKQANATIEPWVPGQEMVKS
jgi:transposase